MNRFVSNRHPKKFLFGIWLLALLISCRAAENPQIRPPAVAGAFYPADKAELQSMIHTFLQNAQTVQLAGPPVAVIAPHAGYVYSGHVAAYAYAAVRNRPYERVVVIAPSHFEAFDGVSIFEGSAYRTPLGDVPVDRAFSQKLADRSEVCFLSQKGHIPGVSGRGEHALEVQLPFLQTVLPKFKLVALVMGDQSYPTCRSLGKALARLISDEKTLIVASSDLSHYHPYEEAVQRDKKVLRAIEEWDYFNLARNFQNRLWEACGGGPIVATMIAAEELGANRAVLLKYANSGDVPAGERSRVVGYSAFALLNDPGWSENRSENFRLNKEEQKELLKLARRAVETRIREGEIIKASADDPLLLADRGAFVTLTIKGQLRGCIGYTSPVEPLYQTVRDVAIKAAESDPRFPPVNEDELPLLHYEISVLSPLRRVKDISEIEVGKHGLLVVNGYRAGLLLPQVPQEYGWNRRTFLEQTCRKAGLPPDAWQDEKTDIFKFTAFVFGGEDE
ncbi:MAG TPA: AmmeMemoRadiSam system protein B [Caldithrix abyssi]|uniref:MEMO1 family protein ENK44_06370 n=1 Tax=Caldithrix abyssi TaxID=187145 RepID=A0A7V4U0D3_CALAY|nr:AmmeMemoRadiSam system protein B [Caldithrix abyssi]